MTSTHPCTDNESRKEEVHGGVPHAGSRHTAEWVSVCRKTRQGPISRSSAMQGKSNPKL